jgi:hypothetical protein
MAVARGLRDRKLQRALLQFFKPENYFDVREALLKAGRRDLIGPGRGCLIPSAPPPAALDARRRGAQKALRDHVHAEDFPSVKKDAGKGYRPGRKTWKRR